MPETLPQIFRLDLTSLELDFICIALSSENAALMGDRGAGVKATVQLRALLNKFDDADSWIEFSEGLNQKIATLRGWKLCVECQSYHKVDHAHVT